MNKQHFEAQVLHTPFIKKDAYNSLSMPVYNTAAYAFDDAATMEDAFCERRPDFAYSRTTNPTVQHYEDIIRGVTGAIGVTALNSGMAAISNAFITIAKAGANIVTSKHLFGNTYSFFTSTLAEFGVETRFCDMTNPADVESKIDENTCGVFLEIITNPQLEVADLKLLSDVCRSKGAPLIADTTVVPFNVFHAKDFSVDIEIISSTKYLSGGATCLGGIIIDYGTFDWSRSKKLAKLSQKFGKGAFTNKLRTEIHRNLGAYMTPNVAYMQTLGIETMEVRFNRAAATALELAKRLKSLNGIVSVNYPGLADNKFYELSKKQFGDYPGAMFTFDMKSREACFEFYNKLKLICRATNLFDNKTLAIHPASTIFGEFTEELRKYMDIKQTTIRMSVGLEDVDDLYDDIAQALQ